MRARGSLVGALFLRIGLVLVALVCAAAELTLVTARERVGEVYDAQLITSANVLRALTGDELRELAAAHGPTELSIDDSPLLSAEDREAFNAFADWRMFRIWRGKRLVMKTDTGPTISSAPQASGFSDIVDGKLKWRVYTIMTTDKDVAIQVGERMGIRSALVNGVSLELLFPLLILIPATAFLIWLSLNDGLKAIRALVAELGKRSGRELTPLSPEAWPRDLGGLVRSVNQLLGRIGEALRRERSFVDQAAHQLRTPLAVVKLQAQMLARASSPDERQELAERLLAGVDRATALTERLLTLARLEGETSGGGESDLAEAARQCLTDIAPLAAERKLEIAFDGPPVAAVAGDAVTVRLVCDNLIENAVRFTPADGEIRVQITSDANRHVLDVIDSGPGIPEKDRVNVTQRFYRGAAPAADGVGLGLSIVAEALRVLDGSLELRARPDGKSGLDARVILPALQRGKT